MKYCLNGIVVVFCVVSVTGSALAAVPINALAFNYSQDFNSLASSGSDNPWTDDSTITGWLWQSDGADQPYDADDGGSNGGSPYSYGTDLDSDRAMGNLGGGDNDNTAWGVVFQNNSGSTILEVTVTFYAEQWREGSNGAGTDTMDFSYTVSSADITDLNIAGGATPAGWTAVPALSWGTLYGTSSGALDGNLPANRSLLTQTISVNVADGEYLALRWYNADASGTDSSVALDDLEVTLDVPVELQSFQVE